MQVKKATCLCDWKSQTSYQLTGSMRKVNAIDLFCGAGGLTHGLQLGGIDVVAGIDFDDQCRYPYVANNKAEFIHKDVSKVTAEELERFFPQDAIKILVGCAPCQPFSTYTHGKKKKDDRWWLLESFAKLIEEVQPEIVSMENVPRLIRQSVFVDFENKLIELGYHIDKKIVFCPEYGIPQTRKRLVLVASRLGEIKLIPPTHSKENFVSVFETIGKLEKINAGEVGKKDPLHRARTLTEINLRRIESSVPGGSWKDWPEHLVSPCHRKMTKKSYVSVYGRMEWTKPAPTITTECFGFGNGRFGHPEQNRALSLREAALLQTFPKSYKFVEEGEEPRFSTIGKLIGNAVPVRLGQVIAESIKHHLEYHGR